MTEYDNTNRGAIFKNNDKTADNQPDYTGKINVDGVEKRIALWIRESAAGNKYMSASISDPMPPKEQAAAPAEMHPLADAIPF